MDKKILLVGTISNVAKTIEKELNQVLKALSIFRNVEVLLVESDSKDNTIEILNHIEEKQKNFSFVCEGQLSNKIPNRIERIAFCRNVYVQYIRDNYKSHRWDYIAVADLDGMNYKLTSKGIESCFSFNCNWSGLMANQKNGYYDLYALRAPNWIEEDIFKTIEILKESKGLPKRYKNSVLDFFSNFFHYDHIRQNVIYKKMFIIKKKSALIAVMSAFGGFAIYKPEVFLKSNYSIPKNNHSSEHVHFHKNAGNYGHKFYINPQLINSNINDYNLNRYRTIRLIRELKKYFRVKNL